MKYWIEQYIVVVFLAIALLEDGGCWPFLYPVE